MDEQHSGDGCDNAAAPAQVLSDDARRAVDLADAIDVLTDVVMQACGVARGDGVTLYSNASTTYADALRFLALHGRVEIVDDDQGRLLTARPVVRKA